ncbi:MAG: hypothetical protein K2K84_04675 [Muribaculaceae bacterium]|nr:hypothetical protein [Muribaculaceae bacterium]
MFVEKEELIEARTKRERLVADTTMFPFLTKYLEREFDRDLDSVALSEEFSGYYNMAPVMLSSVDAESGSGPAADAEKAFINFCQRSGTAPVILRLPPFVIGTGMQGLPRTLARGVARGTMLRVKDNDAEVSAVHAVDVARVARILAEARPESPVIVTVPGVTVKMNDLIEALGVRIKDKRVGSIKPFWAKALYGQSLYRDLTTSVTFDDTAVKALLPEGFEFENPAEYLKSHVYDHESL